MKSPKNSLFILGKPQVNAIPPLPVTNYSHPRCYARVFNDCCSKISREHFISDNVSQMWSDNEQVSTNMHDGLRDMYSLSLLSINNLGANILCERHNNALSSLDEIGGEYCRFMKNINQQSNDIVINGCDLERWFVKVFLGYSVVAHKQGKRIKNWQPPKNLLEILFYGQPFKKDCGLYGASMQNVNRIVNGLVLNYVTDKKTGDGIGIWVNIEGMVTFFETIPQSQLPSSPQLRLHYHPVCFSISENSTTRNLHTGWASGERLVYLKN